MLRISTSPSLFSLLLLLSSSLILLATEEPGQRHLELNSFWTEVSRSVQEGDFGKAKASQKEWDALEKEEDSAHAH